MNSITKIIIAIVVTMLAYGMVTDPYSLLAGIAITIMCGVIYLIGSELLNL